MPDLAGWWKSAYPYLKLLFNDLKYVKHDILSF